jgi:two-component system, NarL family, sensor histidine kinase DesK
VIAPFWTPKHPCRVMVVATVVIGSMCPVFTVLGTPGEKGQAPWIPVPCGAALVALQLWHSYAASRGERPRAAWLTVPAMLALCYLPMIRYTWNWVATQGMVGASLGMVLPRGRLRNTAMSAPTAGLVAYIVVVNVVDRPALPPNIVFAQLLWWGIGTAAGTAVLYGAARMVRITAELGEARTELAELAIAQERLRVSRDLHDLVGQSLSAVSLRGDLALRLLDGDPGAAHAEISTLTATARNALHDVLTVTREGSRVDLRTEMDGARALLTAAGIDCAVSLDCVDSEEFGAGARTVFAWALREGITNVLRHSDATTCSITGSCGNHGGPARLEIVNDGAKPRRGSDGAGLTGLAERARAFGGEVTAGPDGDRFRLLVELRAEGA